MVEEPMIHMWGPRVQVCLPTNFLEGRGVRLNSVNLSLLSFTKEPVTSALSPSPAVCEAIAKSICHILEGAGHKMHLLITHSMPGTVCWVPGNMIDSPCPYRAHSVVGDQILMMNAS